MAAYAATGSIGEAARTSGLSRQSHGNWMRTDPDYKVRFEEAKEQAIEVLEDEARRRAAVGWDEPVFQGGSLVGVKRRYSDTLLIFLLNGLRPERYKYRMEHSGNSEKPVQHQLQVKYVDDWYGASSEAAEASEASEERAAQLSALQDAHLRPALGKNGNGAPGDS